MTALAAAVLNAHLVASSPPAEALELPISFDATKTLLGFLGGALITGSAYVIAAQKLREQFYFLRNWAIALLTVGSTSFYDLDLSHVSFRDAKLANTDLRAAKFYRTCFQGVVGLDRARVDSRYFDLPHPSVQQLLSRGHCQQQNFAKLNLRGAFLQNANLRQFDFSHTNLTGADLRSADLRSSHLVCTQISAADLQQSDLRYANLTDANLTGADCRLADLRGSLLVRAQAANADFTGADLSQACIEDWSINEQTNFTDVRCDYIFRKYQAGQPASRYPVSRNFETGEFAALFQKPKNEVELVFKGEFSYSALSLAFYKLQTERGELELVLQGIEQRGELWIVKITSSDLTAEQQLDQLSQAYQAAAQSDSLEQTIKASLYRDYEATKQRLAESQQLVRQLAGISETQAQALENLSKQPFGNNFFISGSTVGNLTSQGNINYTEAAHQVRSLVAPTQNAAQFTARLEQLTHQWSSRRVATTPQEQADLIQQVLQREAEQDSAFRQQLIAQSQLLEQSLPPGQIADAIAAIAAQLTSPTAQG
ncbi:MAG: pentapeptide repeat-containing protein [Leptolyngbya sp. SIO4C5]|nr:pentapeptide repeat-containing protein [Leptolyngbya sp. SIO4C5]